MLRIVCALDLCPQRLTLTVLSALGPDHAHSLAARATHPKIVVYKNRSTERVFGQSPAGTPTYGEPACEALIDDPIADLDLRWPEPEPQSRTHSRSRADPINSQDRM